MLRFTQKISFLNFTWLFTFLLNFGFEPFKKFSLYFTTQGSFPFVPPPPPPSTLCTPS